MKETTPDIIYWIWLSLRLGAGCRNSTEILEKCNYDAKKIFDACDEEYSSWNVFKKYQTEKLANKDLTEARQISEYCHKNGIAVICPQSKCFPSNLKKIDSCPVILYTLGILPDFDNILAVSMVGTRSMTAMGKKVAYEIATDIAKSGIVIVSGLALGIDGVCHTAAIDTKAVTVAVLGCGIDIIYPSAHRELYNKIIQNNGAIISEYAPGTRPFGGNFPVRNRIISGLSVGTVIVEAGLKSGALNTAQYAFEQGKDVFAVPGATGEYSNMGSNNLLKEGALAITRGYDIVDYYSTRYADKINYSHVIEKIEVEYYKSPVLYETNCRLAKESNDRKKAPAKKKNDADKAENIKEKTADTSLPAEDEKIIAAKEKLFTQSNELPKKIYDTIVNGSTYPDKIAIELNVSISDVITNITIMEVLGLIQRQPGGQYIAK